MPPRRPLVLTGGPAVGKSTTAAALARAAARGAFVDVDDLRHVVVGGHAAPWQGPEGARQRRLGVENACDIARRMLAAGYAVTVADVLTPATTVDYRRLLPGCLIVRLVVSVPEAWRRAGLRAVHLTDAEFADLHARDQHDPPPADHHLDVTDLDPDEQRAAVARLWNASPP